MKVLVTGAAGLLGQAMLQRLRECPGLELHGIDFQSVANAIPHPGDLSDPKWVNQTIDKLRPDQVYHFAGSFSNEFQTDFSANVTTTQYLLEAILAHQPAARLLLIGSAAEYGLVRPEENPITEDHVLAPVSIYGWTKVCQTHLMGYYSRVRCANVVQARLFNLCGRSSPRLFVGQLYRQIDQARRGEINEIVTGPLSAIRDYISPPAAAAQLETVMNGGQTGEVYHVASGIPIQMRQLLERLLEEEKLGDFPVREQPRTDFSKLDVPCIHADVSKTRALVVDRTSTGYEPKAESTST